MNITFILIMLASGEAVNCNSITLIRKSSIDTTDVHIGTEHFKTKETVSDIVDKCERARWLREKK